MQIQTESVILNPQEIEEIREGGKIWQQVKAELVSKVKEGVTGAFLNNEAAELFKKYSVEPAFYNYHDFPGHICVSVNDCIIHGLGNDKPLKKGDKITLDIGFKHKSMYIDSAVTVIVDPESNPEYQSFITKSYKSLWAAIKTAKATKEAGKPLFVGDIAFAVESFTKSLNDPKFAIIEGYGGHAIGKEIHLRPHIYNKGLRKGDGAEIKPNMVICIEPMHLKQPTGEFRKGANGHDIVAKTPGVMTCHWEHMVLIKEDGIEVLTATQEEIDTYL